MRKCVSVEGAILSEEVEILMSEEANTALQRLKRREVRGSAVLSIA